MYKLKETILAYIYKIVNKINGKIYIGKSKFNRPEYLGSGLKISSAIKKYGVENFTKTIIEECLDNLVNDREIHWINFFQSTNENIGYNISRGGTGGAHYWETLSDEERKQHNQKISQARKGQSTGPRSMETRKKQSQSFNRCPDFLKRRADAKRKTYTCVDHFNGETFITQNLQQFCVEKNLNFGSMQHNARTKRNFSNDHWSCRLGIPQGEPADIIEQLTKEVQSAKILSKSRISNLAKQRIGEKNSNAKCISFVHDSGKIIEFRGNFYKDCKKLSGYSYHTMKKLLDERYTSLHGWKLL